VGRIVLGFREINLPAPWQRRNPDREGGPSQVDGIVAGGRVIRPRSQHAGREIIGYASPT